MSANPGSDLLLERQRSGNLDFSLFKNFRGVEKVNLQFRAEAFNFTNSPVWSSPGTDAAAPAMFGS